jgi:hypothetical protein
VPQKGLTITDDDDKEFHVRDGMVVNTNLMPTDAAIKKSAIGKHLDHITFHMHVFPVSKNGPATPLTFDAVENLRKQHNFNNDVTLQVKLSITLTQSILNHLTFLMMRILFTL